VSAAKRPKLARFKLDAHNLRISLFGVFKMQTSAT